MGDEQKIISLYKELNDIQNIIEDVEINLEIKKSVNEKYNKINEIYTDFMDNYLDLKK